MGFFLTAKQITLELQWQQQGEGLVISPSAAINLSTIAAVFLIEKKKEVGLLNEDLE